MINTEFMNGSIDMDSVINEYNSFMESCDNEIINMFANFNMLHEKVTLESAIMDTVPEDMMMVYESEKKNIFTRIGEMIITMFAKIKELIDKGIEKLKELSFKKKTDMQKVEAFVDKHPEFKNEALGAFKEGDLDLRDINSLKELEKAYDEIIRLSKKKDADPKTLKAKWEKAKEKFFSEENTKKADAVDKFLKVGVAIAVFIPSILKGVNELTDHKNKIKDRESAALDYLRTLETEDDKATPIIHEKIGIAEFTLQMTRFLSGQYSKIISGKIGLFGHIAQALDKAIPNSTGLAKSKMTDIDTHAAQAEKIRERENDEAIEREVKKQTELKKIK